MVLGTFLVIQWLRLSASNAGCMSSIPGVETKIPHAAWYSQKKKDKTFFISFFYIIIPDGWEHFPKLILVENVLAKCALFCKHQILVQNKVLHFFYSCSFPVVPKYSFFNLFFKIFNVLNSKSLLVICFKYSSVYASIPISQYFTCQEFLSKNFSMLGN